MTRTTSVEAYHRLIEKGTLPGNRALVYRVLYEKGPMTANEVFHQIHLETGANPRKFSNGRLTELRDMGLVKEMGTRECRITGSNVLVYDVTDAVEPLPREKRPKPEGKSSARLRELEQELASARARIAELEGQPAPPAAPTFDPGEYVEALRPLADIHDPRKHGFVQGVFLAHQVERAHELVNRIAN